MTRSLQLSAMLGAAVMCNTTVRRLVLDGNRLGLPGAVQLAAGLEANATLRSLRYSSLLLSVVLAGVHRLLLFSE